MRFADLLRELRAKPLRRAGVIRQRPISLRIYAVKLALVAEGHVIVEHDRCIDRSRDHGEIIYDWRHDVAVLQCKPGTLRNNAPFTEFPAGSRKLQGVLLKRSGGDWEMVEILVLALLHDKQVVLTAAELALGAGAGGVYTPMINCLLYGDP